MAYSELIKNFERIRDYMRQFYVYGFKSRAEYDKKSARSYDNERRRMESWLGDYMGFRREGSGKQVFLSVDSRSIAHNPLHNAFKAKSFTDRDITLHFYLLDVLDRGEELNLNQILEEIDNRCLGQFPGAEPLDISTLRKKLKEYEALGLIQSRKQGRELYYSRTDCDLQLRTWEDALDFYSEAEPLGVIGSFLLDKLPLHPSQFRFKHHYLLHTLDSQILYQLLDAISREQNVLLTAQGARTKGECDHLVCPLKIYISTQTGRQYLFCYHKGQKCFRFFRLDSIHGVKPDAIDPQREQYVRWAEKFVQNLWGVSTGEAFSLDHIEMTIHAEIYEPFILQRLRREKRGGTVEVLDNHTYKFTADVYDATEMIPWIRTFIGRIEKLECSNPHVLERFWQDMEVLDAMYGGEC